MMFTESERLVIVLIIILLLGFFGWIRASEMEVSCGGAVCVEQ